MCLQVTLWNTGADAYQHHKFGDWVTIERVIKSGSSANTYKLLNSAGKKVSNKRSQAVKGGRQGLSAVLTAAASAIASSRRVCFRMERVCMLQLGAWLLLGDMGCTRVIIRMNFTLALRSTCMHAAHCCNSILHPQ